MSKENGQQQKDSHPPLESSVPFLTSPARAAAGGNNKEDGKFFPYNSRIVRLKDEDRFQVCLDLRRKNAGASSSSTTSSTTTINTTNEGGEGGEENEEERKSRVPNIGDVTAQFAVFDGHITSLAAKYAEKHWLECVFEAIEKEREEKRRVKAKSSGGSRRGSGDNRRRSGSSKSRESSSSNEDGENENAEIDFELEKALIRATGELERGFKEHGVEEGDDGVQVKSGGCFGMCFGGKQKVPTGGTTVTSASIQRGSDTKEGDATFYIVCASCGDSGALLLPHPNEHDPDDREVNLRAHKRLTREHNADDPLEAVRLVQAGCRLGRMQRADGREIGPLRAYPGGFAVSRAVGDFATPGITCEPEVTRVKIPKTGARLLVASDGVFAALSDGDISEICATLSSTKDCADKIIQKVLELRGRHDDITLLVADIPPPEQYMQLFKATKIPDRLQVSVARKKKTKMELMQLIIDEQKEANRSASAGNGKVDVSFDRVIGEDDYVLQEDDFFIDDVADDITVYGFRGTRQQTLVFDEYQIGALLGRGAFGSVRIAVRRETGEVCAVKSLLKTVESRKQIMNEIDTLRIVSGKHPNLPILRGVYQDKSSDHGICYIVTEICGGSSLFDAIARRRWFDENDWRAIAAQLLGAVTFMHSLGVCHRDIKPDNIMCKDVWTREPNSVPHIKLIDFGSGIFCSAGETLRGMHGTKFFASPEMCTDMPYTKKTDCWSVGVVLLTLLSGFPDGPAITQVWHNMIRGIFPRLDDSTPRHFVKLIRALLTVNAIERPSCGEVLGVADDWLRFSWSTLERSKSVAGTKYRPIQPQKLKIPKNLTGDVGKKIKTVNYDFTDNESRSGSSGGGQSSGRSSFENHSVDNFGRHSPISGKKYNAGLLTAENLALLEKRVMKSPKSKKLLTMNEIEEGSEEDHEEKGAAFLTLSDLSSLDERPKKKWHSESGARLRNSVKRIAATVLATEYEKHVANVLSVCASSEEIHKTLVNLQKMIEHDPEVAASVAAGGSTATVHARVTARDLEDATRAAGAGEVAAQLATLRRFHEPPGQTLTLDIEPLRDLEKLHERHDHVFRAVNAAADSRIRIREYTRMDNDMRSLVQSDVHTEMVMAMLGKGVMSESEKSRQSLEGPKKKWITEMLDDSVHSGVVGRKKKTEQEVLEDRQAEEVLAMIHRS